MIHLVGDNKEFEVLAYFGGITLILVEDILRTFNAHHCLSMVTLSNLIVRDGNREFNV